MAVMVLNRKGKMTIRPAPCLYRPYLPLLLKNLRTSSLGLLVLHHRECDQGRANRRKTAQGWPSGRGSCWSALRGSRMLRWHAKHITRSALMMTGCEPVRTATGR
jgi:hypothetical protein